MRLIGAKGENFGVVSIEEALGKAREVQMDLIEISPGAEPPVAKISDYGKFLYQASKKQKESKRAQAVEVKNVQVKIGTTEHDLSLKAKKASEWLGEGHRVKIDLFLPGRSKYLDQAFLKGRLERILNLLTLEYKVAESVKKSPKGLSVIIERGKK